MTSSHIHEVSVLVPCFNEQTVVRRTIDSVLASRGVKIAAVVCIDDGSIDDTRAVIELARHHYGEVVRGLSQPNRGKAHALNRGLVTVETEVFVTIDADTLVLPDTIANLARAMRADVSAASGHMQVANRRPTNRAIVAAQVHEYECANNIDRRAQDILNCLSIVPGAVGAFRSADVRAVGGYPASTLAEDAHLTMLLLRAGHRIVHVPSAIALTEAPDTIGGLYRQRVRWATGKTQAALQLARNGIGAPRRFWLVWLHMVAQQVILPPLRVPVALAMPACAAGLALSLGHADDARLGRMVAVLVAVWLADAGYVRLSARFARDLDDRARAAVDLPVWGGMAVSHAVIMVVTFASALVAWCTVATGRKTRWNKVARRGDVTIGAVEPVATPGGCRSMTDQPSVAPAALVARRKHSDRPSAYHFPHET